MNSDSKFGKSFIFYQSLRPEDLRRRREEVEKVLSKIRLSHDTYEKIRDMLIAEFIKGLGKETNASATIKMFPSYVRAVPDGTEQGDFLALDLGGTNFRILRITLEGNKVSMQNKIYMISKKLMTGPGTDLFDYIAACLSDFVKEQNLEGKSLPLGFTFSFPCKQEGLTKARLISWTKGFTCPGVVGEDVVNLLQKSLITHPACGKVATVVALMNDTVGTLISCAFTDYYSLVGIILGTGSNACYMEKLENVELWDSDYDEPKQVIINTEWGAFGSDGALDFMRTKYDYDIDQNSLNPGKQIYEKMISGFYMGELVRLALVDLCEKGLLFNGNGSDELYTRNQFFAKYVSEIESDLSDDFPNTRQVLDEIGIEYVSQEDCAIVQYACTLVSSRAAYLASAGVAAILTKMHKPKVTVAVDGSLYRYHPKVHNLMMDKIGKLVKDVDFKLILSEDGSGKGAALVAAVASRLAREKAAKLAGRDPKSEPHQNTDNHHSKSSNPETFNNYSIKPDGNHHKRN
ncbi:unnamed protein product [Gordionus sp. m RMFG-2023]